VGSRSPPPGKIEIPFGHNQETQEEVYVVVGGSAQVKVDDEIVELARVGRDPVPGNTMRQMEGRPDGLEYLAFGAGDDPTEAEPAPGWWSSVRDHHQRDAREP
jgi:hypothetical protein